MHESDRLPGSFTWLNTTQFFGALNDNLFKLFIVFFLIHMQGPEAASEASAYAGGLFVIPFLLFATVGGVLADRVSKRSVVVGIKVAELGVMSLAVLGFYCRSQALLFLALFLMATQSAVFSPSKFGIIPELVGKERLSRANSFLQAFTYLAIIAGTCLAPFLSELFDGNLARASLFCIGFAALGLVASVRIEPTPASGSERRASVYFLRDVWRTLRYVAREDGHLLAAVCASSYFLLVGGFVQMNILPYGIQTLGLTQERSAYLFLFAAIGIGLGSLSAGKLSGRNIEFGLVPLGALLLTISMVGLWGCPPSLAWVGGCILAAGIGAGLFVVPLQAFIQFRSPAKRLGEVLAATTFLSFLCALIAAGLMLLFSEVLGLSARKGFLAMGLLTLFLSAVTLWVLPDFFVRFIFLIVTRLVYRLRILGGHHLPVDGAGLIVANHVSWIDPVLIAVSVPRRIRFLMSREIYDSMRFARPLLKLAGVIPVSGRDRRDAIEASLTAAREQLDQGFLVCIFAEGSVSRSGMMRDFKSGFTRILENTEYPLIPAYIGGAWGSIFSYYHGRLFARMPIRIPYPVTLVYGEPMPPNSSVTAVRVRVQELSTVYFDDRKEERKPLPHLFVETARRGWTRQGLCDTTGVRLTFGETLVGSLLMADALRAELADEKFVGVFLPASVGGALANVAVSFLGKVPVNLNFTASPEALASAVEQCGIRKVIASRLFLKKIGNVDLAVEWIPLEDLRKTSTKGAQRRAFLKAKFWPTSCLVSRKGFTGDSLATVMFSSGSTGTPKGVMLSHHNIESNVEGADLIFRLRPTDRICGSLPLFHSFGYTCTLWLPLLTGVGVTYHPNPLEASRIVDVVRDDGCTLLVATPTFLQAYTRKASREDFQTLRYCIVGAEKLKDRLAQEFMEKFGIRPLEGYGATECAPLVSINVPDVRIDGVVQRGTQAGSVGHPLPGVAAKVVDPETGAFVEAGGAGVLMLKGPNIMLGYLGNSTMTNEVLHEGWYNTGDIVRVDHKGFITITDRLSRFSKIGGEMVPHMAIEDALLRGLNTVERVLAVTSVPDERKGEKVIVLYTEEAGDPARLREILKESDLPNLWKPGPGNYVKTDHIPMLGSGKLDLSRIRALAAHGA